MASAFHCAVGWKDPDRVSFYIRLLRILKSHEILFQNNLCDYSNLERKVLLGSHEDTLKSRRLARRRGYVIPIKDAVVPDGGRFEDDNPDTHDFVLLILKEPAKFGDKGMVLVLHCDTQPNPY